jgi:flagellar biosynthesis/type III secretory pathway chaperone
MLDRMIREIENKYNADNDFVPNQPMVSWTENQLLQMIKIMAERIDELETKVQDLRDMNPHTRSF